MAETTYSIPRWRYLSRGEVMDGFDWRPLRAEERLVHDTVTRLPQVENDWVR